jgi:hypothetical protein
MCALQAKLQAAVSGSAASHSSQASPARSTGSSHLPPGGDPEAERLLQRRLAAKAREAEAAGAALAAAQQAVAAREAELEAERARCAALSDELAHCREDVLQVGAGAVVLGRRLGPSTSPPTSLALCLQAPFCFGALPSLSHGPPCPLASPPPQQRDRELKSVNRRLEAAASHAALLDDTAAALRKQGAEAGTALAQRDVAIRGLEDRLRALQVPAARCSELGLRSSCCPQIMACTECGATCQRVLYSKMSIPSLIATAS